MIEQVISDIETKMRKTADALIHELSTIRTGRATPALVEHIKVDYHGVPTPINQIASISIPDVKMILIQPWDRTSIHSIEKAILKSELGLNPNSDSIAIRISIPPLTEERRKELLKVINKRLEEARVSLRNVRRQGIDKLRQAEKNKEISKDQCTRGSDQLQKLTDSSIEKINRIGQDKEKEIMEV